MTETLVSTYQQGTLTAEQLQAEIDSALAEILAEDGSDGKFGISRNDADSVRIAVEGEGGFDPASVLITIAVSFATGMASEGGKTLLRKILERVRQRRGDDALGDQEG